MTERYDDAEAFAAGVEALITKTGAIGALPRLRAVQAEVDLRRGNWTLARARAKYNPYARFPETDSIRLFRYRAPTPTSPCGPKTDPGGYSVLVHL